MASRPLNAARAKMIKLTAERYRQIELVCELQAIMRDLDRYPETPQRRIAGMKLVEAVIALNFDMDRIDTERGLRIT